MLALLLWALVGRVNVIPASPRSWYYLAGLGVIVQGLGYLAINYSLGYLSSAKVTLVLLLQPVLTAILAVALLKERLTANQVAGGLTVLIGLAISFLRSGYLKRQKA
jgi:drug/metabolite transporter (DMT)-like permease